MITNDEILVLLADAVQTGSGVRIFVSGRSMGPAYASVSDIQVVPCVLTSIPVGRLVVFQRDGRWVVHRVMWRIRRADGVMYLTKGDGLSELDQPCIQASEIKGMVSGLGFKGGATMDPLSFSSRFKSGWIVIRFWIGRLLVPFGRDPRPGHPA